MVLSVHGRPVVTGHSPGRLATQVSHKGRVLTPVPQTVTLTVDKMKELLSILLLSRMFTVTESESLTISYSTSKREIFKETHR